MAYSLEDQYSLDLNWYFSDAYNRLCIAASAGSILPKVIADSDQKNDQFHAIVNELPERYEYKRNENIISIIQDVSQDNINSYFQDFESLARKGLHVFDKFNIAEPEDPFYILVASPIYDPRIDPYPIAKEMLSLIPKTKVTIHKQSIRPVDLNDYLRKLKP
ncbi:MAG: hypothetical protein JKY52_16595 [Flavobacteriales bacterium]|nr:hypothetical protein [Flavobacteriales bacterium]